MARFNRFGATAANVMLHFVGAEVADIGSTVLESLLDDAVQTVIGAMPTRVYGQLTKPDLELVEEDAAGGETTVTLGLTPIVAGSLHVWVRGRGDPQPMINWDEDDDATVVVTTGVVTLGDALVEDEQVFATYEVDVDNASFSVESLRRLVELGAAVFAGPQLYGTTEEAGEWTHVRALRDRWGAWLKQLSAGTWVPDELRKLRWWTPVERRGASMSSVRIYRA